MQRLLVMLTALSLLLASCGTLEIRLDTGRTDESRGDGPVSSSPEPATAILAMDSTSEQIQGAMLESATKWRTIWIDGIVTEYSPDGTPTQFAREQVWIDQSTNRFRVLNGPRDGGAERFLAGDGMTILEMDLKSGQSQSHPMPEFANGPHVPALQPGFADSQPLWRQIGTRLSELVFPSDFSQNEGVFKPLAIEMVAGRQTLMVEWTYIQNTEPSWKLWLDTETVVVLKAQFFQKTGGGAMMDERVVNQANMTRRLPIRFLEFLLCFRNGAISAGSQFSLSKRGQSSLPEKTRWASYISLHCRIRQAKKFNWFVCPARV